MNYGNIISWYTAAYAPGFLTVAEWLPAREGAFAAGVFNAGSNVGAILAPVFVPMIALQWRWRAAFIATAAIGFVWLAAWLLIYRNPSEHPTLSATERAHINGGQVVINRSVPWSELLKHQQT